MDTKPLIQNLDRKLQTLAWWWSDPPQGGYWLILFRYADFFSRAGRVLLGPEWAPKILIRDLEGGMNEIVPSSRSHLSITKSGHWFFIF